MKITLDWLREHLDGDYTAADVVATLNRIGLEVEGVENPAEKLAGFRVAKVLTAEKHPQADKLQVLTVDTGEGVLQVVCGAPNARAGLVGVLGLPGAVVPVNGMELKVAAVRGVESNGMMCSTRELELGDDHDGIIELPADAPIGTPFADYSGAGDPVIDISITPNRQDCMGVRGIARDLAAAGLGTLKPLAIPAIEGAGAPATEIRTDDPEACPAFYGRTIAGVDNRVATPEWMRRRLEAIGQRSISALVDISNYVMFDLGRPSHIYDRAKLHGALVARRARDGETVTALNGKDYALDDTMTVIADEREVHDIAGIMGGEHSGCSEETTDVLIEIAYFTPERIALTGQALGLTSDARSRFERGVDPAFLDEGTAIVTRYVLDICGGTPSAVTRAGTPPVETKTVAYDPSLSATLGGIAIEPATQRAILESLGFGVAEGDPWTITVPSWRRDVDAAPDIVEEVTRITGFDAIASAPLPRTDGVAKPTATAEQLVERRLRRSAAAAGFHEAVTWSFISEREAAPFGGGTWSLANPISEDLKVMRPSLLPGLLAAAARNQNRGADSIRLFEIGRRYIGTSEHPTLGVLMVGDKTPRGWQNGKAAPFDAFDAKAAALALLDAAGAPADRLQVMEAVAESGIWHPGQSATLRLGPKAVLAEFGALHPSLTKHFDVDGPAMAVQIFLDAIPARRASGPARAAFTPPALQSVRRDFAFLAPESLAAGDLVRAIRSADKVAIVDVRLFDRFAGTGVPEGQVSLAVEVELQPVDNSFTDAELRAIADKVVASAAKVGAVLRG
ncbi:MULTISPECIES: phenylalanine--tRNA ligase subunit beta [unclassified Sphingopyxis]|uniref:phenylalanine--tRNA ligase subunit beta n=1 Tax=unclassified Sphingopyxis TaxID=2614943 RepID=UPI000730CFEE|nr:MULTISPECIES: phenylalanine--tRNA ligase subunit beta [unclassified Sphingopyxis]KTE27151.1 phenylalanine--tRNA ligase subunit beta [Sphingopyxis sp. H057]KTE53131.1 phenylalanine--tRNA ligase subunit beta [Sphingopyxis sp. H107]KTE54458.1 phenylalanine--tRNA ligase subunit beta [Sphingopyxis sp. H073]KTE56779.1 phenylalanine--tRNA ligase subunit beta [Sphingopyxis sp. H071]KTE68101.1 phenylalanine--tRNA ligase subunit beta [Sphingopyxis sp. H100]